MPQDCQWPTGLASEGPLLLTIVGPPVVGHCCAERSIRGVQRSATNCIIRGPMMAQPLLVYTKGPLVATSGATVGPTLVCYLGKSYGRAFLYINISSMIRGVYAFKYMTSEIQRLELNNK